MDKIKKIIIACYRRDFYLTRICVASIRFFYPEIEIFLIKDEKSGKFPTYELEKTFKVNILHIERKKFGWGLSKLEPLFLKTSERVLIIDSDIIFVGNVLDNLESINADFIVSGDFVKNIDEQWVKEIYLDVKKTINFDKDYIYPGFFFNTGNLVVKTGSFNRCDFENLIEWTEIPKLKHPEIFPCADQGILNYLISKRIKNQSLLVKSYEFMLWGKDHVIKHIDIQKVIDKSNSYPFLIHYAGTRHYLVNKMCRSDILIFFENYYYSFLTLGKFKRLYRNTLREIIWQRIIIKKHFKNHIFKYFGSKKNNSFHLKKYFTI